MGFEHVMLQLQFCALCVLECQVLTLTNIEETVSREFGPPFCEIFRKLWCLHTA